jgi:hypothetical protein
MGFAIAGAAISAAATIYSSQQQSKAAYDAAVRQNEVIKNQYAADAAKRKGEQDAMAAQNARENAQNAAAVASDSQRRQALASVDQSQDSSETLLTGSAGVRNAFRRRAAIGGET